MENIIIHKEISKNKKLLIFDIKKLLYAVGFYFLITTIYNNVLGLYSSWVSHVIGIIGGLCILLEYQGVPILVLVWRLFMLKIKKPSAIVPEGEEVEYDNTVEIDDVIVGLNNVIYTIEDNNIRVLPVIVDVYGNIDNNLMWKGQLLSSVDVSDYLDVINEDDGGLSFIINTIPDFYNEISIEVEGEFLKPKQFEKELKKQRDTEEEKVDE